MDNEAEDRKRENHKRPAENRFVFHAGHNINFFQLLRTHADTGKIILENEKDRNQDDNDRNENDRSQIHKEVIEIQVCRGTDHDVWRISDHKCRTAYVAHQYFRNQNRHVMGAIRSAAVTESMSAAPTAVTIESKISSSRGDPFDFFSAHNAST